MKIKGPEVDPETKRREEQAAARADASRERETKGRLSDDTDELLRVFGARAMSGLLGSVNGNTVPNSGSGGQATGGGGAFGDLINAAILRALSGGIGGGDASQPASQAGGNATTPGTGIVR